MLSVSCGWRAGLALQASHLSVMEVGQLPCCLWSPLMRCNLISHQQWAGFLPLPLTFVLFHCCLSENNASCAILMCAKPLYIESDNHSNLCVQYVQSNSTSSIQTLLSAYQAGMECPPWNRSAAASLQLMGVGLYLSYLQRIKTPMTVFQLSVLSFCGRVYAY